MSSWLSSVIKYLPYGACNIKEQGNYIVFEFGGRYYRYSVCGTLDVSVKTSEFCDWWCSKYTYIEEVSVVEIEHLCLQYEVNHV